ncbi:MAG TPA: helix-turn-helix transcriptional regulator [Solirubrobacteraceae bacterium]|jgi:transcriptional regulator with XRE-family HTH domain|nr:helix-turn-helix transcriptional regulator [Solirubrobacteraceae bacterium]
MKDDLQEIGSRVRAIRTQRGVSQAQLAHVLEVDESTISKIEKGKRGLAAGELALLCEHLQIRTDDFLFGERDTAPSGVLLRAADGAQIQHVRERVEGAFADYRYLKALVDS